MPDSIAGLSESGANAEHTGKSCSRLELVVRECGLMLQGMVSVFLFDGHAFWNLQNPFRFPGAGEREGKIRSLYTGILDFFLSKLHSGRNYRDIHDRGEIESFHGKRPHFSLHTFILHKPPLFTTCL